VVQQLAEAAGAHVSTEYEDTSLDAIRQMAGMGAGIAIVPSLYALIEASKDPHQIVRPIAPPCPAGDQPRLAHGLSPGTE